MAVIHSLLSTTHYPLRLGVTLQVIGVRLPIGRASKSSQSITSKASTYHKVARAQTEDFCTTRGRTSHEGRSAGEVCKFFARLRFAPGVRCVNLDRKRYSSLCSPYFQTVCRRPIFSCPTHTIGTCPGSDQLFSTPSKAVVLCQLARNHTGGSCLFFLSRAGYPSFA
jgi:hypothetical protein